MKNCIAEHKFYKSKSIMIVAHTISVNYGTAENYLEFKFANRPDEKSGGNWDEENRYFFSGFVSLCNLASGIDSVVKKKEEKFQDNNPLKKKGFIFRINVGDDGRKWAVFHFFRGKEIKIRISLDYKKEFIPLYKYLIKIIDTYQILAATALFRNDYYYKNIRKNDDGEKRNSGKTSKKSVVNDDDFSDDVNIDDNNLDDNIDDIIDDMPGLDDDDVPF